MTSIALTGTLFVGPYKGYHGSAEYDADVGLFHGEVSDTRDVITFQGRDPAELRTAFQESIDDYLDFCESRGEDPDKPYSGKWMIRMSPELHRELAMKASRSGKSLNEYACDTLQHSVTNDTRDVDWGNIVYEFEPLSEMTAQGTRHAPTHGGWTTVRFAGSRASETTSIAHQSDRKQSLTLAELAWTEGVDFGPWNR